jgi:hypothetical protein
MSRPEKIKLGATGRFPRGRIHASDEGELRFGVAADPERNLVALHFGGPVAWVGMPPDVARKLAETLVFKALEVERSPDRGKDLPS